MDARQLLADLTHFPWKSTALTLGERFREDRLGLTASSLTFTTTMALVPLFTVALAVFTAFPVFGKLQGALQAWLVQSLVPDAIARQVLGYLTQFAGKANRLGALGLAVLFITALALVLTRRAARTFRRFVTQGPGVARRYRADLDRLTSRANWARLYDVDE